MAYQVLALKYRPGRFDELIGQEQVTAVLKGALQQKRTAHAYLFSGPRGCGKTTTARILAKALNCESGPAVEPCGSCPSCRAIAEGTSLSVIEIDAASNRGIDDIRRIREESGYAAVGGRFKVYIVDEAHQITGEGANAFLKTLEEPAPNTVFILATTEAHKILPTISSRCQRFQFRLLSVEEIATRLGWILAREKLEAGPEVLQAIARRAEGSMRDGVTLLDQVLASIEGKLELEAVTDILGLTKDDRFYALSEAWLEKDGARALRELDHILGSGLSEREFAVGLSRYFRNLLMLKLDEQLLAGEMTPADRARSLAYAERFNKEDLLYLTRLCGDRADQIRFASQPRIQLETLMVEIAQLESRVLLAELLARLNALEEGAPSRGSQEPAARARGAAPWEGGPRPGAKDAAAPGKGPARPKGPEEIRGHAAGEAVREAVAPRSEPMAAGAAMAPRSEPTGTGAAEVADPECFWGDFLQRVGQGKKSLESFLAHARPGPMGQKHFTVFVENSFHMAILDTPEHHQLMRSKFAEATGKQRQIRLELVPPPGVPGTNPQRISPERAQEARRRQDRHDFEGDDLIQDLLTRFDGEVLED